MKTITMTIATCLLLAAALPATAQLPPGTSGPWFNPQQSGHGISIELISADSALIFWNVYDRAGRPMPLYIEGAIEGTRINGTAYAPNGMRFGVFNPAELRIPVWGQVNLQFRSCDHATLSWNAIDRQFGSGSTDMVALTRIAGLNCTVPPGLYQARITRPNLVPLPVRAAIDPQGRLWAVEIAGFDGSLPIVPGTGSPGAFEPIVVSGQLRSEGGSNQAQSIRRANAWISSRDGAQATASGTWSRAFDAAGGALIEAAEQTAPVTQAWSARSATDATHLRPLALATIAGDYRFSVQAPGAPTVERISIGTDGSICVGTGTCRFRGQARIDEQSTGFFDFSLRDELLGTTQVEFRGRGWLERSGSATQLVMVGDNVRYGLGVVAVR